MTVSEILEKLDKAISEVAELGLDCETELWAVHEHVERLTAEVTDLKSKMKWMANNVDRWPDLLEQYIEELESVSGRGLPK